MQLFNIIHTQRKGKKSYVCLGSLSNAVGAMYVKEYFPESSKTIADDMVTNIK